MAARRSLWLDERALLLVRELRDRHRMALSPDVARDTIADHLVELAQLMGVDRQAARKFVTEDTIIHMADEIAAAVRAEEAKAEPPAPRLRVVRDSSPGSAPT